MHESTDRMHADGYRPELPRPIPGRILSLPVDARGYPIPWFVPMLASGEPEFRGMDVIKWARAVRERRCWICGDAVGRFVSFVTGPMCVVSGTSAEPPSHAECARWSARACPFLSRPHAKRRVDEGTPEGHLIKGAPGIAIERNPGVTAVVTTRIYRVFRAHVGNLDVNHGRLIEMGDPSWVEWFASGREATREEVLASIASGFPALDARRAAIAKFLPVV